MTLGVGAERNAGEQRALIVYQDALLRDLVQHMMRSADGITVAHACHVREFTPSLLHEHEPTVVVADRMPAESVVTLLEAIAGVRPNARVVSVSLGSDELYVLEVSRQRPVGVEEFLKAVRGCDTSTELRSGGEVFSRRSADQQGG
ncbi:MAG: hypothetical protein KatS3mg060_2808 [Dehalococcoidia bacterium]|jgi:DNA-binding NarL/FixJ family response regulator|nr:MAG: hypothetical protein KatS3mg060_2808 [Dehalococcoidia bacterium]